MKYMFLKNISLIKEKIYKYFLTSALIIILFLFIDLNVIPKLNIEAIKVFLGLNKLNINNTVEVIIKFISYLTIICFTVKVYLSNIEFSMEYIVLRIKRSKLLYLTILNVEIITILTRLIILLIVGSTFYILNNLTFFYLINIIFIDLLFYINLSLLIMLLLNIIYRKNIILKCIILFVLIYSFFINLSDLLLVLPFTLILLLILNFITFNPSLLYCNTK